MASSYFDLSNPPGEKCTMIAMCDVPLVGSACERLTRRSFAAEIECREL